MKKILFIIPFLISLIANSQDVFKTELFSADIVLKHRKELNLTDAQINNIKRVYSSNMEKYNSLKWDLDAELVKMENYLSLIHIDSLVTMQQMDNILELESAIKLKRLGLLISIKNELYEGQQMQLKKIKASSSYESFNFITPINENPRVVLKIDGPEISGQPVYYIMDKSGKRKVESVKNIEPNDIERVDVIKGAAAEKSYGKEGKNGVVLIYLKRNR